MDNTNIENLISIYKRAMQYCVAKFGGEPDELHLLGDGSFKVVYGNVCHGEYYEDYQYFESSCLTQDLDSVYEERIKAEKEEKERQRKESLKRQREQAEREKEARKDQYLKLKKEFES